MNNRLFKRVEELAGKKSLNEYLNNIIQEHVEKKVGEESNMDKIEIGNFKLKDLREAVTVTQKRWYMEILENYNIYFFSPTRKVSPMMYIFFYSDSSCEYPNSISHVGKVSLIYRGLDSSSIQALPELKKLLQDNRYSDEILSWNNYQIAVLSNVEKLRQPIDLTKDYLNHPRIIVNRTTTIGKALSASKIDDLFQ